MQEEKSTIVAERGGDDGVGGHVVQARCPSLAPDPVHSARRRPVAEARAAAPATNARGERRERQAVGLRTHLARRAA